MNNTNNESTPEQTLESVYSHILAGFPGLSLDNLRVVHPITLANLLVSAERILRLRTNL